MHTDDDASHLRSHYVTFRSLVFFCVECGMGANKRCSACKSVHYCSVEHQREHWYRGHKEDCARIRGGQSDGKIVIPKQSSSSLYDEWEIITEEEPSEDEEDEGNKKQEYEKKLSHKFKELKQINKMQAKARVHQSGGLPEDFPVPDEVDEDGSVDDSFISFQHRIKRAPDQVLR